MSQLFKTILKLKPAVTGDKVADFQDIETTKAEILKLLGALTNAELRALGLSVDENTGITEAQAQALIDSANAGLLKDVSRNGTVLTFTKNDDSVITINIPSMQESQDDFVDVNFVNRVFTFTKRDGSTKDINLPPLPDTPTIPDNYIVDGAINGTVLTLTRANGSTRNLNLPTGEGGTVDLSGIEARLTALEQESTELKSRATALEQETSDLKQRATSLESKTSALEVTELPPIDSPASDGVMFMLGFQMHKTKWLTLYLPILKQLSFSQQVQEADFMDLFRLVEILQTTLWQQQIIKFTNLVT